MAKKLFFVYNSIIKKKFLHQGPVCAQNVTARQNADYQKGRRRGDTIAVTSARGKSYISVIIIKVCITI